MSDDDLTFVNQRLIAATPSEILAAFREPERLARWWGPAGFRNTFHDFDFRPGGDWKFTMHGPEGGDYENHCRFQSIGPDRLEILHLGSVHAFRLTLTLEASEAGTRLTWRQTFELPEDYERVNTFVPRCNEENLDRLESELQRP
ncbi:SRPBCC family protein [Haloferula sargassicola]|uniref:Activator of Hsp90 ATPase homologue 1/2-like C-terminal domain-containing protein n=1 Tax=Haloferula sargassicola TaxID=490096 RepID=A0ABP9UN21_9BACT